MPRQANTNEIEREKPGAYIIVGRPPDYPYWEWVFTDNPTQSFQEVRDPNRVDGPLIFLYKEEAQGCLSKLLDIKYQRGLMFGCELQIIDLKELMGRAPLPFKDD